MLNPPLSKLRTQTVRQTESEQIVSVGMGKLVVTQEPNEILTVVGLGSCVAVVLYDPRRRVGAMLHAMLPRHRPGASVTRFVDSGTRELIAQVEKLGVNIYRSRWYLAGGAQMLSASGFQDTFQIGGKNIEMATAMMQELGITPIATDLGGTQGRTVRLYMASERMTVRTAFGSERIME